MNIQRTEQTCRKSYNAIRLAIIVVISLFLIAPVHAAITNVSILYGWNGNPEVTS